MPTNEHLMNVYNAFPVLTELNSHMNNSWLQTVNVRKLRKETVCSSFVFDSKPCVCVDVIKTMRDLWHACPSKSTPQDFQELTFDIQIKCSRLLFNPQIH